MNDAALVILQSMMIKILPLYAVMALGFLYGRMHRGAAEPLSFLQIYFISPIVIGSRIADLHFQIDYLSLPLISFLMCCVMGLISFRSAKIFWKDSTPNLLGLACGEANTGYYGLPVAMMVFSPEIVGVYIMTVFGVTLYENTLGYYLIARGHFTMRDSLIKLIRLPNLYAFIAGVLFSLCGFHMPDFTSNILRDFSGCYVVLGALMIGLGLSRLQHLRFEYLLIAFSFMLKFVLWPAFAYGLIMLDNMVFHAFSPDIHKIIMLISVMPMPANVVAFAMQLKVQPDRGSTLVFLSTLFALFYVPLVMALWG